MVVIDILRLDIIKKTEKWENHDSEKVAPNI